jgi:hypothetical protein
VCCISIPRKWYPGLKAEIRWHVVEWEQDSTDSAKKSFETEGIYIATVPIEAYGEIEAVYVHFFEDGKTRITPSIETPWSNRHPAQFGEKNGGNLATKGEKRQTIFSDTEMKALRVDRNKN